MVVYNKTVALILQEAGALVAQGHAKGSFARDSHGYMAHYNSPHASAWCATGAVYRSHYAAKTCSVTRMDVIDVILKHLKMISIDCLYCWSDTNDQQTVVNMFKTLAEKVANESVNQ